MNFAFNVIGMDIDDAGNQKTSIQMQAVRIRTALNNIGNQAVLHHDRTHNLSVRKNQFGVAQNLPCACFHKGQLSRLSHCISVARILRRTASETRSIQVIRTMMKQA